MREPIGKLDVLHHARLARLVKLCRHLQDRRAIVQVVPGARAHDVGGEVLALSPTLDVFQAPDFEVEDPLLALGAFEAPDTLEHPSRVENVP